MKISVAMCAFNGERYLLQQLESLSAQARQPDELVLCDDCSTDQTIPIASEFASSASYPVRIHINDRNLGSTVNFEQAIAKCEGEIIALCDQDDVWLPEKLATLEAKFAAAPGLGLVFSDAEIVNEDLTPAGYSLWEKLGVSRNELERLASGQGFQSLLQGATVTGATMAFRSRFRQLVLPIPADLPIIHDAWITVLIAAVAGVLPVNERLIKYRKHDSQQVGALERNGLPSTRGLTPRSAKKALTRENPYAQTLTVSRAVHQRLTENAAEFESRQVLPRLESQIAHLQVRSTLPGARLTRGTRVLRELFAGRYHRYGNGARSAVKDLFG
jgi:glycosyltransferase involved in cell wall biosynthesis